MWAGNTPGHNICNIIVAMAKKTGIMNNTDTGILADNASALTGKYMKEYIASTNGDVEIIHIPPILRNSIP